MKKLLAALIFTVMSLGAFAGTAHQLAAHPVSISDTTKHTKKDGTPDKRYKENKTKKVHLKADGTPDKRYKENKTN